MTISTWLPERRRRIRRLAGFEVPASLATVRGEELISGNLYEDDHHVSRARKRMTDPREPDRDLAAELRQSAGREWIEEAAEDERLSETFRRRKTGLAELMAELASRGDRVSIEFGGHTFSGSVLEVGSDFATILGPGQVADIRLGTAKWSVLVSDQPAELQDRGVDSLVALLKLYEAEQANLRLALPGGDMVIGKIAVVASDHVEVADVDDRLLYVPIELVLGIIRSIDFH